MATITLLRNGLDESGRPRQAGDTFDCSAAYADLLINDNRACYADGQQGVVVRYKDGSLVSWDGYRVGAFERLLSIYGVVGNGTTDDASNFQEALNAAAAAGTPCELPPDIQAMKFNTGLVLDQSKHRINSRPMCRFDFSGVTSGVAMLYGSSITNGNVAPLSNITNGTSGIMLVGGGVAGVTAIKVRSATGFPYFYLFSHISADNFETTVDLGANCFGTGFEDVAFRAAPGINNTLIQCLTGDGSNYGERFNFIRAMLYNSGRVLLNTNAATTFRFLNSSFDYCDVMADIQAGRVSLESCHVETNKDTDYLFKLSGNESSALTVDKSELVLNGINRSSYEIFDIADAVKFGGIAVRDSMIAHGAGYSLANYVRGKQRAVASGLLGFTAQAKPTFSRHMNRIRDLATPVGGGTTAAGAEWTLSGVTLSTAPTAGCPLSPTWALNFAANAAEATAIIVIDHEAGKRLVTSWYYRKTGAATAGQGKIQFDLEFLDSKGTAIAWPQSGGISPQRTMDTDGVLNAWTLARGVYNADFPPPGTRQFRITIRKTADAGAVAAFEVACFNAHPV